MNISLPQALRTFVDQQVAGGSFGTGSEYIRELIRKDQDRQNLRQLLLDAAASSPGGTLDDGYYQALRNRARDRATG